MALELNIFFLFHSSVTTCEDRAVLSARSNFFLCIESHFQKSVSPLSFSARLHSISLHAHTLIYPYTRSIFVRISTWFLFYHVLFTNGCWNLFTQSSHVLQIDFCCPQNISAKIKSNIVCRLRRKRRIICTVLPIDHYYVNIVIHLN